MWDGAGGLRFSELIERAGLTGRRQGKADPRVTTVAEDSRSAGPEACFVAVRGTKADGHAYVEAAIRAGAVAVVHEQPIAVPETVAALQVESARGAAGRLAAALHGLDRALQERRLKIVGITGTNGKSTFCFLLQAILREAKFPAALLGTVQYDLLSRTIEASMTTPPAATLVAYLAEAARAGASHAVMEVSSHALDQRRCDGLRFSVGVFSNLTGDHFDYHQDMESYLRAKKRLFDGLDGDAVAAINRDDPASERMVADCPARIIRYGIEDASAGQVQSDSRNDRDWLNVWAGLHEQTAVGTRFTLRVEVVPHARFGCAVPAPVSCEVSTPLIGRHNVQNCLAAAAAAIALGVPLEVIARGLQAVTCVPGRLQRVVVPGGEECQGSSMSFAVFVDYAHTDDALTNVLSALKPLAEAAGSRLIVLFGCGGDRDRTKRPRMARAAARFADRIILTSDNPRSEDPLRIVADVMEGFSAPDRGRVQVVPDRRRAIGMAIAMAGPGDIVLLAGKGHETYQQVGQEKLPFDDLAVAAELLVERRQQVQSR